MAEYIVLSIGIFFKRLLNYSSNLLPKNDKDKNPIKVIRITEIIISSPGMLYGK